jgi:predicted DCC family thiol-disulfide oxidoreductase YuxK
MATTKPKIVYSSFVTALPADPSSVTTERHPLALFFDGECVFCNRWVRRLMTADIGRRTRFGAKQGVTFQRVVAAHPQASNVASIVLVQRVTPRPLADQGYAIFSKFRKRIFGAQNVCDVVRPAERELFLD